MKSEKYRNEMMEALRELVSYNSVQGEPEENAPFGKTPKECLMAALKLVEKVGLKAVNVDNYAGYGEIGEGEEVVGILGHLDIVPAGEDWLTDPFVMTEKDGYLYGRGVSDDKGAVVAALYAIRMLMDEGYKFKKRVRLIMGTNEETGSACLAHYVEKEGHIDYGFTPDANFPGVYGEKGMVSAVYSCDDSKIISISGGAASNVVANRCKVTLPSDFCDFNKMEEYLNGVDKIEFTKEVNSDSVTYNVTGVAAHASMPELGVNAIAYTLASLKEAGSTDSFVEKFNSCIGTYYDGTLSDVKLEDSYGVLTYNVGVIKTENGVISGTIDIRNPVTLNPQDTADRMAKKFAECNFKLEINGVHQPLFFAPDSPMVSALVSAYRDVTGDTETEPMTIGGGTYAKGINNCIGFGCEFLGTDNHIHDANEKLKIEEFFLQADIYAEAIKNLCEL